MSYPFLKGHGTENDFVLLPDHDGRLHGDLSPERVRALCDRRAGIGADGVLRVVRSNAIDEGHALASRAEWFMDYRNADGTAAQMCGNGARVFVRHLIDEGLASPVGTTAIATRDGVKLVSTNGPEAPISIDLGPPRVADESVIGLGHWSWPARNVSMGNPHAVVFVDSLEELGDLGGLTYDAAVYPDGVNVEFVHRLGERAIAMRVHERGVGETRSCGTGACAAMVAAALADGLAPDVSYDVRVPGGSLLVTWTESGVVLTGPAVIVASGETDI